MADDDNEVIPTEGPSDEQSTVEERKEFDELLLQTEKEEDKGVREETDDFYRNLAEDMDEQELDTLGSRLLELLASDESARAKRDSQYAEGINRTGAVKDPPGGADFEGASKVAHPTLLKAAIEFQSAAVAELLPPDGPVRSRVRGEASPRKLEKADKKAEFYNDQLTAECPEFYPEMEQLLSQLPFGGSQYMKYWWNGDRPTFQFTPVDHVFVPASCGYFYKSPRITHVQRLTHAEIVERQEKGVYRDVDVIPVGADGGSPTTTDEAVAEVAGKELETTPVEKDDSIHEVPEFNVLWDVEGDGPLPYLITVERNSGKVLSIYRAWIERGDVKERLHFLIDFTFLPWRDALGIGLPHVIGKLSSAATGALRALLDAAHVNNAPTLLMLKGTNISGQTVQMDIGTVNEVEGSMLEGDIRKAIMAVPFNPPSTALFQLLGFLTSEAEGMVRTVMDESATDASTNVPVGTQLSRVEQGLKVFSTIHRRLHRSMARLLEGLHVLYELYLDDSQTVIHTGSAAAKQVDFQGPMDVQPVSDPAIFSDQQRMAQVQAVAQRAQAYPMLYNLPKVEERLLKTMKVPSYEELLQKPPDVQRLNPVTENLMMGLGKPVGAFPDQDHLAHIQAHVDFFESPMLGQNPFVLPQFLNAFVQHVTQHVLLYYLVETYELSSKAVGVPVEKLLEGARPDDLKKFDELMAAASQQAIPQLQQTFEKLPPVMQKAMQLIQSMKPPMIDPNAIAGKQLQIQEKEVDAQVQATQGQMQLTAQKQQMEAQRDQVKIAAQQQADAQKQQADLQKAAMQKDTDEKRLAAEQQRAANEQNFNAHKLQQDGQLDREGMESDERMNDADNATAMTLAEMEIESGEKIAVSTGRGLGPNPGTR